MPALSVTLMVAILMTVLIAIPLAAGADQLERRGVPRWLGSLASLLVALLPILLTSVGDGSVLALLGQVFSALGDLAATLLDWITGDLSGAVGGRG